MSYSSDAKNNKLSITLRDLGINENTEFYSHHSLNKYIVQLVTFTPTKQSHLGNKFAFYKGITNRTTDTFLQRIFSGLGVANNYLFNTYTEKTTGKNDLYQAVIDDNKTFICLRCDNGVKESLYAGIRNSLAHGNIIKKDNFFWFYSVSDDKNEFDSNITFLLKIKRLVNLQAFSKALEIYK